MLTAVSHDQPMFPVFFPPAPVQVELLDRKKPVERYSPVATPSTISYGTAKKLSVEARNFEPQVLSTANSLDEQLSLRKAALKISLLQVQMHLNARWRDRIFAQLDRMLDPAEWDDEEALPDLASFATALRFILYTRPSRISGLGLSSSGNFIASWSHDRDHLTIECRSSDQLVWSLLIAEGDKPLCSGGTATIVRISEELAPFDAQRWF